MRSIGIKRLLAGFILFFAAVLAAIFLGDRYGAEETELPERPEKSEATLSISRFAHTATREGKKEWTLVADTAEMFEGSREVELSRLEVVIFTKDGEEIKMYADHGWTNLASKNIRAWDNVVVCHPEYTLRTQRLNYQHDSRIIETDTPLEVIGNAMVFTADAARYEIDDEKTTLTGNIESWFDATLPL